MGIIGTLAWELRGTYLWQMFKWLEADTHPFPALIYEELERRARDGDLVCSAEDILDLRRMYGHSKGGDNDGT